MRKHSGPHTWAGALAPANTRSEFMRSLWYACTWSRALQPPASKGAQAAVQLGVQPHVGGGQNPAVCSALLRQGPCGRPPRRRVLERTSPPLSCARPRAVADPAETRGMGRQGVGGYTQFLHPHAAIAQVTGPCAAWDIAPAKLGAELAIRPRSRQKCGTASPGDDGSLRGLRW